MKRSLRGKLDILSFRYKAGVVDYETASWLLMILWSYELYGRRGVRDEDFQVFRHVYLPRTKGRKI